MSYKINLNVLNNAVLRGYTNDRNITLDKVMEMFDKSNIKINVSERMVEHFDETMTLHLRKQASKKIYDPINEKVFEDGEMETTVYLVVEQYCKVDNEITFDPQTNEEYILQTQFKEFTPYEDEFYIFCLINKTHVMKVSNDMPIGHLAYKIHEKHKWPMIKIRLVHQGRPMDFNNTITDYGLHKDSTVHVLYRASSGVHYAENSNGEPFNGPRGFNLDSF